MLFVREVRLSTRSKVAAVLLGAVLLVVVGVFLAFGFVLLLGLAAAGLVLGAAAALYRRLTGRPGPDRPVVQSRHGLDPAREISPPPVASSRPHHRPPEDSPK